MTRRCAIYTRKSTEEGLDQDFNSLDAQREACEAYIKSQVGEGWRVLRERYDDGGYSGGTLERPAVERLLADIRAGKIDTVVVYKVDRLTRSLTDFAKIVEVFDAEGVAFVSVTQQFNTTTSMGRLTLNMLLSFAQFEREVTGERIRDKIAASKKKGMWMGGLVPLGYDAVDRKLVVNPSEAETVRELFRLYLECGSVNVLRDTAQQQGYVTKLRQSSDGRMTGGQPFTRGHLYQLLRNPLYAGKVSHKGVLYPGQHPAIVDAATYEAVQRLLTENAAQRRSPTNAKTPSLLAGLVYDEQDERLCPSHASKKGRRYRYYISKHLMHGKPDGREGWRLPARALEEAIQSALRSFLLDRRRLLDALDPGPDRLQQVIDTAASISEKLGERAILEQVLYRAMVSTDNLCIEMRRGSLEKLLIGEGKRDADAAEHLITFNVPLRCQRRGVETKLVLPGAQAEERHIDENLIALVAQANRWFEQLSNGQCESLKEVAKQNAIDASSVRRDLQLAFLAPDIVQAILEGRQPVSLTAQRLRRIGILPMVWERQRRLLGVEA